MADFKAGMDMALYASMAAHAATAAVYKLTNIHKNKLVITLWPAAFMGLLATASIVHFEISIGANRFLGLALLSAAVSIIATIAAAVIFITALMKKNTSMLLLAMSTVVWSVFEVYYVALITSGV